MNKRHVEFSVIICTYNRSASLLNNLKSLQAQDLPEDFPWEIVVVDNNSIDDTQSVVTTFAEESGLPIRYVKEENQGLSNARNKGVIEAQGKYVAFTDDDAIVDRHWVREIYNTFETHRCDCVGGKIYLQLEKNIPKWLTKDLWGFLGYLDYGDTSLFFDSHDKYPHGGNIAFTKEVFDRIGYFNPTLGRTGNLSIGGEEVEFFRRLLKVGGVIVYQPAALVHHVISSNRLKKKYFRRLHYLEGDVKGRDFGSYEGRTLVGIPFFIFPRFLRSVKNHIFTIFSVGWNNSLRKEMNIWYFLGFVRGRIRYSFNRRNTKCPS